MSSARQSDQQAKLSSARQSAQFEELCREHHPAILREAIRLTRSHDDAWDLVQDTYERALRSFDTFRQGTNAFAWLRTIMTRRFIDDWRLRNRRPRHSNIDDMEVAAPQPEEQPLWETFAANELDDALERIPEQYRTIIEAHALRRESYASLSERLQAPIKTVGTRLFRARAKLRAALLEEPIARAA
jgi:RNA polymerase sigma-70 factor, ECF subfamily